MNLFEEKNNLDTVEVDIPKIDSKIRLTNRIEEDEENEINEEIDNEQIGNNDLIINNMLKNQPNNLKLDEQ